LVYLAPPEAEVAPPLTALDYPELTPISLISTLLLLSPEFGKKIGSEKPKQGGSYYDY